MVQFRDIMLVYESLMIVEVLTLLWVSLATEGILDRVLA